MSRPLPLAAKLGDIALALRRAANEAAMDEGLSGADYGHLWALIEELERCAERRERGLHLARVPRELDTWRNP
jgi:hypothetical protein